LDVKGKEYSISGLEDEFNLLSNPNFEDYYELANFYKDNEYYEKSIKYYSLALRKIKKDHFLVPKILDRRGTSFERIGSEIIEGIIFFVFLNIFGILISLRSSSKTDM